MLERLIIAGSGGQGVILLGKVLAFVAVDHLAHVTFFPAYGAEVRGGTSNCQVVFSSDEIASPTSDRFDSMIIMNQASADKFLCQRADSCLVILNRSLCAEAEGVDAVEVDALRVADTLGQARAANFVMLGAYLARRPVLPVPAVERTIQTMLSGRNRKLIDIDLQALHTGLEACRIET